MADNTFTEAELLDWVKEKIDANINAVDKYFKDDPYHKPYYEGANDALEELLVQWDIVDKYGDIYKKD